MKKFFGNLLGLTVIFQIYIRQLSQKRVDAKITHSYFLEPTFIGNKM